MIQMEKKQACTILALCASCVFTAVYFLVFGTMKPQADSDPVVVAQPSEEPVIAQTSDQLNWIQLGVYQKKESYADLYMECQRQGMEPLVVRQNDRDVLIVGCTPSEQELQVTLKKVCEMEIEYMVKNIELVDSTAQTLAAEKKYQEVLEGYVYQ